MTIVWLCYILTCYYFSCFVIVIISPSFPPKNIYVKLFTFFFLLLRCQIEFKCLHTSVYVYIVHVLLLTNIDCTWLNIESELFIRPRDYQIVYSFIYTSPVQRFNAHLINSLCFFFFYPSLHLNDSVFMFVKAIFPKKFYWLNLSKHFSLNKPLVWHDAKHNIVHNTSVRFTVIYCPFQFC